MNGGGGGARGARTCPGKPWPRKPSHQDDATTICHHRAATPPSARPIPRGLAKRIPTLCRPPRRSRMQVRAAWACVPVPRALQV